MKNSKKILLLAILSAFIGYFIYSLFDQQCSNFNIVDVSIRKVIINDSLNEHANREYYLIEFIPEYCNCKKVFMGGRIEEGRKGIVDKIRNISVLDSLNHEITFLIKGWNYNEKFYMLNKIEKTYPNDFFTYIDIKDMIKAINNHEESGIGFSVKCPRLFYIESQRTVPKIIKISFTTRSIEKKVDKSRDVDFYTIKRDISNGSRELMR